MKTYSQLTPFKYTISIQERETESSLQTTPVMTGFVPGGSLGADATLLIWRGDDRLDVLIPNGGQASINRDSVGVLSIKYDHYDSKLPVASKDVSGVESLKQVSYEASQKSEGKFQNCSIAVQGIDPQSSRRVGVVLNGTGINLKYLQGEFGSFSAAFFVSNAPKADRDGRTLTQVEIEGVPIFDERIAPVVGPVQDSTVDERINSMSIKLAGSSEFQLVRYGNLQHPIISAMFEHIRNGKLAVTYILGYNDQKITYRFKAPINEKAARAYQKCEATTRIFLHPVGQLLQAHDGKEK